MPSIYLQPEDYAPYEVPSATVQQVQSASALLDGYLRRPEGMLWAPDYAGLPCYMAAMNPRYTFTSVGIIPAGVNVVVPLTTPIPANGDLIGETVVLDRVHTPPNISEVCVIAFIAPGVITLASVAQPHAAGTKLDLGMCILEERELPSKRSIARVSRAPIERLVSGLGRYGYGRRLDQTMGMYNEVNLLAAVQAFGGPPMWVPWDVNQASVSQSSNEIWVPAGILLAYYSTVRLRYLAGYSAASMPSILKQATAAAIAAKLATPELSANIKMAKAGDTAIQRFSDTVMDSDMKSLLEPFRARLVV